MTLEAIKLSYRAGAQHLLKQVSLTVHPGRIHAILGPNGAGKSTLLKLLAGELTASSGKAQLDSQSIYEWPAQALARRRAVMQQQNELRFGFELEDVLALGRLPWAESRRSSQPLIDEALTRFGLAPLRARRYTQLSGGERARAQLARAWLQVAGSPSPGFLLLDEPFASLDLAFQLRCQLQLSELASQGFGVAVVMHEPTLAMNWADDCSLLRGGELIANGSCGQIMSKTNLSTLYDLPLDIDCTRNHSHKIVIPAGS